MTGNLTAFIGKLLRLSLAATMALGILLPPATLPAQASNDRTLWLHHAHTGETARFTFKRNGQFDKAVLRRMNVFLADWRTKEPTEMDPALFDLMWQIYQEVGGTQPINIVSSYRSPKTNNMLRAKSSGVAENSQHMRGKAMDFFIPGVNLSKLRATAMKYQVGGVGYYPTSGSPFVHVDTGSVRAWPRMTRAQLMKVFPDGKTLHLPTDGKPLSQSGRAYAQAQWNKCRMVPCNGRATVFEQGPSVMLASVSPDVAPVPATRPDNDRVLVAAAEPTQRVVSTIEVTAPVPLYRPKELAGSEPVAVAALTETLGAPVPATKSARIRLATRSPLDRDQGGTALAALNSLESPSAEGQPLTSGSGELVTAYAPEADAGAQLALQMIIERSETPLPPLSKPLPLPDRIETAALDEAKPDQSLESMFDMTFASLNGAVGSPGMAAALADLALDRQRSTSLVARAEIDFVAPDMDHVNETLVEPVMMTTSFWAELTEAEGYLEKGTELGPLTARVGFIPDNAAIPAYDRFVSTAPLLVAGL